MKPINAKRLEKLNACDSQIIKFRSIFGDADAPLDVKTATKYASIFDWNWASTNLLSREGRKAYDEAKAPYFKAYQEAKAPYLKAYYEAVAPHSKAYEEAVAPHMKAYKEAKTYHLNTYEEAIAPYLKSYQEAVAPYLKAYQEAVAKTFAELYLKENESQINFLRDYLAFVLIFI